jgi:hypothetical protein
VLSLRPNTVEAPAVRLLAAKEAETVMKDTTLSRLGRTCSILLGISLIVVGITYLP